MNKYHLLESFFTDPQDFNTFLEKGANRMLANDEATCTATFERVKEIFLYKLTWLADGKYIGDYVKPFEPTPENIETFNRGCKILAERLEIYIDSEDISAVPEIPPAFGELTEPNP